MTQTWPSRALLPLVTVITSGSGYQPQPFVGMILKEALLPLKLLYRRWGLRPEVLAAIFFSPSFGQPFWEQSQHRWSQAKGRSRSHPVTSLKHVDPAVAEANTKVNELTPSSPSFPSFLPSFLPSFSPPPSLLLSRQWKNVLGWGFKKKPKFHSGLL